MNDTYAATGRAETQAGLGSVEFRGLFVFTAQVLSCDALRLKPRERQFALLLAGDSLGEGREQGRIGVSRPVRGVAQGGHWCARLSDWRPSEIWEMCCAWRRAGWIAVDEAEGCFRLAPDRLPGWADARRVLEAESRGQDVLPLTTPPDLHKEIAKFSQAQAKNAKISQTSAEVAKISQPSPGTLVPNVKTFNRSDVQRINVERSNVGLECDPAERGSSLADRTRRFVGEADWAAAEFWNQGRGWRSRIFLEEAAALSAALDYCESALASGEIRLRKTRGAFLWDEFQRCRAKLAATR